MSACKVFALNKTGCVAETPHLAGFSVCNLARQAATNMSVNCGRCSCPALDRQNNRHIMLLIDKVREEPKAGQIQAAAESGVWVRAGWVGGFCIKSVGFEKPAWVYHKDHGCHALRCRTPQHVY